MEQSKILIYQTDDGHTQIDVRLENDTVWLNTKQMSSLFDREESNIRRHILGVFKEGELVRKNNVHFLHVNGVKKPVPFYNLDVIISVGYRVKSKRGIDFRIWARGVLKDFLIKGYAVNERMRREQIAELRQLVSFWVQEREVFGPPFSCTRRRGRIDLFLVRHSEQGGFQPLSLAYSLRPNTFVPAW